METSTFSYHTCGGMLAVSALRLLAETALEQGAGLLRLTANQCVEIPGVPLSRARHLRHQLPPNATQDGGVNPTSTAPVADFGEGRPWVRESTFSDALEGLGANRGVSVHLADPLQRFLPLLCGTINFIAAPREEQWETVLVFPGSAPLAAPGPVRGKDLAAVARRLEAVLQRRDAESFLRHGGMEDVVGGLLTENAMDTPPPLARYRAPAMACEWVQPPGGWAAKLIEDLCIIAVKFGVSTVGATPWRTLILGGLDEAGRDGVERVCLNHRHAPNANPWRQRLLVSSGLEEAADELTRRLHAACPVNPGVSIAMAQLAGAQGDVHYTVQPLPRRLMRARYYRLLASSRENVREGMPREIVQSAPLNVLADALLRDLEHEGSTVTMSSASTAPRPEPTSAERRCSECASEYNEELGDAFGGVMPGTRFAALPAGWCCPVCGAPATAYV